MKKTLVFCLVSIFAYSIGTNAQTTLTAEQIVDKHFEAIGGKDKLKAINTMKMTGKIDLQPGMTAEMTMQVINKKALRMDLNVMGMIMNQVVYENTGWAIIPFQGNPNPEPLTEDQVKDMKKQTNLTGDLLNFKEEGSKIELVGSDEVEGAETYKIKLKEKDGSVTYKFFDKSSFYLLKEIKVLKLEDKETEVAILYSNFKKTDSGLVFPFVMNSEMAGGAINWDSYEINPKIDETIFKMPAKK